jgi:hypothetical protein
MRNEKMTDDDLLALLQRKEDDAAHYVHGQLGQERETALREYYRMPYGNEEDDGWSKVVSSDVSDSVEWILPALLKTFTSTDKAVSFEPTTAADVKGSQQATDACNYVFYKQNNGFLVLYTAIKDMLTVRNCAVMWRKETKETVSSIPFKGATQEMLAMLMQEQDAEIESANQVPMMGQDGQPMLDQMGQPVMGYDGRLKKTEKRTICKVEAFSPEDLLVEREWTSPLLQDCPYVARLMRVTMSDLKEMGLTVSDDDDLEGSDAPNGTSMRLNDVTRTDTSTLGYGEDEDYGDESMSDGWLRIEFVLVDMDGDGIAERRCIYRLQDKILKNEVVSHVPIATASPILNTHRWDGQSIWDLVSDLQKLHTELLRQTLNNLYLTNNPRTKVLTDSNWSPLANLDDLLDSRPGGILRQRDLNAISEQVTPFSAGASMPMLEYVQGMRENRTGVSRTSMGMNPDSLNNTATGRQIDQSASQQRVELIARIIAETLIKPIFQGILKVLTDGEMQKLAFRLRDEFVEYDPNEWRDSYDMTINVGLGTGDSQAKAAQLTTIYQMQQAGMGMGLATPANLYHTMSKIVENSGFKDVQNFLSDPKNAPPAPPPQPPIELQLAQMKIQADTQKSQAEMQQEIQKYQAETQMQLQIEQMKAEAKRQEIQASLELQAANDMRDSEREQMKAQFEAAMEQQKLEFEKWKAELDARVKLRVANIGKEASGDELLNELDNAEAMGDPSPINQIMMMQAQTAEAINQLAQNMSKPKQIVRDANGRAVGVQSVEAGNG